MREVADFGRRCQLPGVTAPTVLGAFYAAFDLALTNRIYMHPTKCDFMASLAWNTFASRVRGHGIDLSMFTEAVAVIQNTAVINDDLSTVAEICPNLPPSTVFALLSVRELDEFLTTKPCLNRFAIAHGVDLYEDFKPLEVDPQAILAVTDGIATDDWDRVVVPAELLEQCPFLKTRFSH
jgi:hypothetical protein